MIEPMLADLAEAARRPSAAEQLAARVAGHAHCPVLLRTLHIGGTNLKSRATCDSAVLPRASRSPRVSRDAGHIRSICYKLQAEAIRGCNLNQIARLPWQRTHTATGGGVPDASLLLPAGRVHPVCLA